MKGENEMLEAKLSNRPAAPDDLKMILRKYLRMTPDEKDIMQNAILEIFSMFDMDPRKYQLDFRFTPR